MVGILVTPSAAPAAIMGPLATNGLVPTAPTARVVMEGPMGTSAPEMAVRTGATLQVAEPIEPTAAATAAVRCLPTPVVGAVPTAIGPTAPALVPPIRPPGRPFLGTGRVPHTEPRTSHAAAVLQAPIETIRPGLVAGRRPQTVELTATAGARVPIGSLPTGPAPVAPGEPGASAGPPMPVAGRAMRRAAAKVAPSATRTSARGVRATQTAPAIPSARKGGPCPCSGQAARPTTAIGRAPATTGAPGGLTVGRATSIRKTKRPFRRVRAQGPPRPVP